VQSGLGAPVANFQRTVCEIQRNQLIDEARGVDGGTDTCDIGRGPGRTILPTNGSRRPVECVHVADTARVTALIGADEDELIRNERIAVEAGLVPILVNVVAPPHFADPLIEGVEGSGA